MSSEQEEGPLPRWPNWLGIVVEELEGQRRFYRNVLGIAELDAGEDWVQVDMGGAEPLRAPPPERSAQYDRSGSSPASRSATSTPLVRG